MSEIDEPALFAVCLGGRVAGCNVELHDVVFAVGTSLEACHPQLLDRWFGEPDGLHVDAWARLDAVDGHRVSLSDAPSDNDLKLWFVNVGGYVPGEFGERHAYGFLVGASRADVKARAKAALLPGKESVHRDDLYGIDDLVAVEPGGGRHVHLEPAPSAAAAAPAVTNGYFPIPRQTIATWKANREPGSP